MTDVRIGMDVAPKDGQTDKQNYNISHVLINMENTEVQTLFRSLGGLKSNPKDKIKM